MLIPTQEKTPTLPRTPELQEYEQIVAAEHAKVGGKPRDQHFISAEKNFHAQRLTTFRALDDFKRTVLIEYLKALEKEPQKKERVELAKELLQQIDTNLSEKGAYTKFVNTPIRSEEELANLKALTKNLMEARETIEKLKKEGVDRTNPDIYIKYFSRIIRDLGDIPGSPDREEKEGVEAVSTR